MAVADRLAGGVWGHLLGDAAGFPYEGFPPTAIPAHPVDKHGPLRWSDDGALMLAQLDSLLAAGVDPEDFGRRALAWFERGAYTPDGSAAFGIGRTTHGALRRVASGEPAATAGGAAERDCGNGSLMRVLPVGLAGHRRTRTGLIDAAHQLSAVTHAHPQAEATCALYVLVVARVLAGDERMEALEASVTHLQRAYAGLDTTHGEELSAILGWRERRGTGYVVDCFWTAWDAFAAAGSFTDAVERAIARGNDTDTTAAVCGGLAGAHFGRSAIPSHWLDRLVGREIAEPLVHRLTVLT